ncbi:MAG TPA: outer membrane lipoprotein carrier protein LolA [Treponemataceae bacterium]|nr:outer membrane lipoprotein carrier protein LolA [Treponemataceae bacterium]
MRAKAPRLLVVAAFFVFGSFAAPAVFAQSDVFSKPATGDSRAELERSCAALSRSPVMRGSFTQRREIKKLGRSLVSSGRFALSRADGMLWDTRKPFPSAMALTDSRIVQTSGQGKKSVIDARENPSFQQFADTIRSVFSGDVDALFARFEVFFVSGPDGAWELGLIPKDATIKQAISSMRLSGKANVEGFVLLEPSGDTVTYRFADHSFSEALTDDERKLFSDR